MGQAPNRLAGALGYVADAYLYMTQKAKPSSGLVPSRRLASVLSAMVDSTTYRVVAPPDLSDAIRLAMSSSWAYAGIRLIADRVASREARFFVQQRVDEELRDIRNHPFELLMDRPNSIMTADYMLQYTAWWLYLQGNAYWFLSTPAPGMGEPEEIWPIPGNAVIPLPETIRKSRLTGKQCIDYRYDVNGKTYLLPGENVVHFRNVNPFDYWLGLTPLMPMMDPLQTDKFQKAYLQGFFGIDNAIPTAIISLPAETSPMDFEIAKEAIREQFGQGRRSAIIRAGDMDVKTITQTLQQMELITSRKFNREEIEYIIGIPNGLIAGGLSGDSRLAADIQFTRGVVQPLLDRMAAECTANIAPYYGWDVVVSSRNIVPQDRALKVQEYGQYAADRSINENRRELGLPELQVGQPIFDLMINLPTRLLPYASSNSSVLGALLTPPEDSAPEEAPGPAPERIPDPANGGDGVTESKPGAGDMPGMVSPLNLVDMQSQRSASMIGMTTELQRWKKVAVKTVQEGRDAAERPFSSVALAPHVLERITNAVRGRDEVYVKAVFDYLIESLDEQRKHL